MRLAHARLVTMSCHSIAKSERSVKTHGFKGAKVKQDGFTRSYQKCRKARISAPLISDSIRRPYCWSVAPPGCDSLSTPSSWGEAMFAVSGFSKPL